MPRYKKQYWILRDALRKEMRVIWLAGLRPERYYAGPFARISTANNRGLSAAQHHGDAFYPYDITGHIGDDGSLGFS